MIACRKSGKMIKGSFYEFSSNASSYRGELLGLVAIHTLILHVCRFYQPTSACGKIICDSKLALYKSSQKGQRRIWPGVPQADLFCVLRSIHCLNLQHKENVNNFKQMFQREIACTAIAAHNVHEWQQAGRVQEGGTGAICFGDATGYIRKVGKDEEGLGCWSWILFGGSDGHTTRLITAYNPCKSERVNSGKSYQQQRRYFIMNKKDLTCPRTLFRRHLTAAIARWRDAGERIVLFMDHNEHVYDGVLRKALSDRNGLNLQEVILKQTRAPAGAMFFRGLQPIDRLWASDDLDISNACVMPFGYGVGDHHAFVLDIPLQLLVGVNPVRIVQPAS